MKLNQNDITFDGPDNFINGYSIVSFRHDKKICNIRSILCNNTKKGSLKICGMGCKHSNRAQFDIDNISKCNWDCELNFPWELTKNDMIKVKKMLYKVNTLKKNLSNYERSDHISIIK